MNSARPEGLTDQQRAACKQILEAVGFRSGDEVRTAVSRVERQADRRWIADLIGVPVAPALDDRPGLRELLERPGRIEPLVDPPAPAAEP